MGAGRLLLSPTRFDYVVWPTGPFDLQSLASVPAPAGTSAARGERGRAAMVLADCGPAGAKRAAEDVASQRQRQVVEAIGGRLPAGLRVAGGNCAAVEKPNASRADFSRNEAFPSMKTHPSTAEFRLIARSPDVSRCSDRTKRRASV